MIDNRTNKDLRSTEKPGSGGSEWPRVWAAFRNTERERAGNAVGDAGVRVEGYGRESLFTAWGKRCAGGAGHAAEAYMQLIWAGHANWDNKTIQEASRMPVLANIEDHENHRAITAARLSRDAGHPDAEALRYPPHVGRTAAERASVSELDELGLRLLDARNIEELFSPHE